VTDRQNNNFVYLSICLFPASGDFHQRCLSISRERLAPD
jgi:hypothetical protein